MTPNQRLILDRLEYPYPGVVQSVSEVLAPLIVFVAVGLLTLSMLQGWAQDRAAARCQEIAAYFGVAKDSPATHRMLPAGVEIKYVAGRCLRTDTMTEMTGDER